MTRGSTTIDTTPLVQALRQRSAAVLEQLFRPGEPMALLDYPTGHNVGDQAIWLGTTRYLAARPQYDIRYITDRFKLSFRRLASAVPPGATILIHGGGNLGDVYPSIQHFREAVIEHFPNRRIIQMPQSIHFSSPEAARRAAAVFNAHPDLTILTRDERSAATARELFSSCGVQLCPDMAFHLDLDAPADPELQAVWIARDDDERRYSPVDDAAGVLVTDWQRETPALSEWMPRYRAHVVASELLSRMPGSTGLQRRLRVSAFDAPAWQQLSAGLRTLGRGQVVVTDRLHGFILSLLLGLPHVLLDNSYGKLRNYHDSWTSGSDRTWWATSPDHALELALSLDRGSRI